MLAVITRWGNDLLANKLILIILLSINTGAHRLFFPFSCGWFCISWLLNMFGFLLCLFLDPMVFRGCSLSFPTRQDKHFGKCTLHSDILYQILDKQKNSSPLLDNKKILFAHGDKWVWDNITMQLDFSFFPRILGLGWRDQFLYKSGTYIHVRGLKPRVPPCRAWLVFSGFSPSLISSAMV